MNDDCVGCRLKICMFGDVKEFHEKFGHMVGESPRRLTRAKLEEGARFLEEELKEFREAVEFDDADGQADALVDLVYVAIGIAVKAGLPWQQLWDDVHRANMAKVRGSKIRGGVLQKVDCVKPDGWVPPRTSEILEAAGFDPLLKKYHDDEGEHDQR